VLTLWKSGFLNLHQGSLSVGSAVADAAVWGLIFLIAGFFEESLFRGYVQFTLLRGIGFWWGAVIFSLIFGYMHLRNSGESPVGLASVVGAGLIFSLSLWYTGSLWWAVGFHAAWDWGQSYFYGTPDSGMLAQGHWLQSEPAGPVFWSGGTTGPEGSILVVAVLLISALVMALWWGRRGRSPFTGAAWTPLKLPSR
jgi:membrane protease YdiL (CAAX protease family)